MTTISDHDARREAVWYEADLHDALTALNEMNAEYSETFDPSVYEQLSSLADWIAANFPKHGPHLSPRQQMFHRHGFLTLYDDDESVQSTAADQTTDRRTRTYEGTEWDDDLYEFTAGEVVKLSPEWYYLARLANRRSFTGWMDDPNHIEARNSESAFDHLTPDRVTVRPAEYDTIEGPDGEERTVIVRAAEYAAVSDPAHHSRPFFKRSPTEADYVIDQISFDNLDQSIMQVTDGRRFWVLHAHKQHLRPGRAQWKLWVALKHENGQGPKLRRNSWFWNPLRFVEAESEDHAASIAWRWKNEIDLSV